MSKDSKKSKIFIHPSGFIEQHYLGELDPETILDGLKKLRMYSKKIESANQSVLILEDVSKLTKLEFLSPKMAHVRKTAAKAIKEINFDRVAIYGSLQVQIIVSSLALVAGKRNKVQVFDNRAAAVRWLLNKK